MAVKDEACFFRVAAAAFSLRRKTMVNCLCATLRLPRQEALSLMAEAGLDEMIRGEKLTLEELGRLADLLTDREQQKEEKEEQS